VNEPTILGLFSGIGGFELAAQWAGFRVVGMCEIVPQVAYQIIKEIRKLC
jgi:site-specific DNA-cytosine methylase